MITQDSGRKIVQYVVSITFFSVWLGMTTLLHAQGQASFGLLVGFPQGTFHQNVTNPGGGIAGHIGYRLPGSPAVLALDMGYLIYGHESRVEPFSTTIPDVTVDVSTDNSILLTHFLLRLQPPKGSVRPYIDGLVGFNYLFTRTSIHTRSGLDFVASSVNFDDFAFSYGGGGGLMLRVYDGTEKRKAGGKGLYAVLVDFRVRYLTGSEADYLKKGSIRRQSGQVTFDVLRSETDMITAYLGATIDF